MANEEHNTNSTLKNQEVTSEKSKSGTWDWIWPSLLGVIIVKIFGLVGGLVTLGSYFWLKLKIGTWPAVAASGVIGVLVAIGLAAIMRG